MDMFWTIIDTSIYIISVLLIGMLSIKSIQVFRKGNYSYKEYGNYVKELYWLRKHRYIWIALMVFIFVIFIQEVRVVYLVYLCYTIYILGEFRKQITKIVFEDVVVFVFHILVLTVLYTFGNLFIPFDSLQQVLLVFILLMPCIVLISGSIITLFRIIKKIVIKK